MIPMVTELKIDREMQRLIPPLSNAEYEILEKNILRDGCRDPICVWQGVILDGHNRYEICNRHGITYTTVSVDLVNRDAAIAWICANQIGRRNITEQTRKYLIGKRYEAEKKLGPPNSLGTNQHSDEVALTFCAQPRFRESRHKTAAAIGREYNVCPTTVQQYGRYAFAIDSIANKREDMAAQMLSGQMKISDKSTMRLSGMPAPVFERACEDLINCHDDSPLYSYSRKIIDNYTGKPSKKAMPCIKDMPPYDPDAEISILALTIPSWRSSIERICSVSDIRSTSIPARHNLANELHYLNKAIGNLLTVLKERKK